MSKKTIDNKDRITESEYSWFKKIDKHHPNKQDIQNQIDSFMFYIENEDYIDINKYKDELLEFCDLILNMGHLNKLDDEYQNMFNELNKYIKDKTKVRTIMH